MKKAEKIIVELTNKESELITLRKELDKAADSPLTWRKEMEERIADALKIIKKDKDYYARFTDIEAAIEKSS